MIDGIYIMIISVKLKRKSKKVLFAKIKIFVNGHIYKLKCICMTEIKKYPKLITKFYIKSIQSFSEYELIILSAIRDKIYSN